MGSAVELWEARKHQLTVLTWLGAFSVDRRFLDADGFRPACGADGLRWIREQAVRFSQVKTGRGSAGVYWESTWLFSGGLYGEYMLRAVFRGSGNS